MSEQIQNEIKAALRNIRDVKIKSGVKTDGNEIKVVTAVSFEYDGEPSTMEPILNMSVKAQPIHVKFYTPQLPLGDMLNPSDFDKKD